jgi:hypothetical protein
VRRARRAWGPGILTHLNQALGRDRKERICKDGPVGKKHEQRRRHDGERKAGFALTDAFPDCECDALKGTPKRMSLHAYLVAEKVLPPPDRLSGR